MSWFEDPGNETLRGLNMSLLGVDECYVQFVLSKRFEQSPWEQFDIYNKPNQCLNCPHINVATVLNGTTLIMDAVHNNNWFIERRLHQNSKICSLKPNFDEFGIYSVLIDTYNCTIDVLHDPVNIYLPILSMVLITLALTVAGYLGKCLLNQCASAPDEQHRADAPKKTRIKSIDTFRGISIVIMIFVNYGAGRYQFLEHALWNGLHVADLVFPWFMWIMGVCIPIAIKSALKASSRTNIMKHIARRTIILFVLGLCLNTVFSMDQTVRNMRICGVLQRFALCYFVIASLYLAAAKQEGSASPSGVRLYLCVMVPQWAVVLSLLLVHTVCTFFVAKYGCPKGYLGPGGIHDNGKYFNCTGGATGFIDRYILTVDHLYQRPTISEVYRSEPFDPEGLFGTLTSVFQVFLGVQAGYVILTCKSHRQRLLRWLFLAAVCGLVGGGLCGFSKEDGLIPLNKNLWSLSFVLVTSCFAYILLAVCYVLIDVTHVWSGKPFVYPGMNATIMYIGHNIASYAFPFQWRFLVMNTHFKFLFTAVWGAASWILVAYWLFSIKFFLSLYVFVSFTHLQFRSYHP